MAALIKNIDNIIDACIVLKNLFFLLNPCAETGEMVGIGFEAKPGQVHAIHDRRILNLSQSLAKNLVSFELKVDVFVVVSLCRYSVCYTLNRG